MYQMAFILIKPTADWSPRDMEACEHCPEQPRVAG